MVIVNFRVITSTMIVFNLNNEFVSHEFCFIHEFVLDDYFL